MKVSGQSLDCVCLCCRETLVVFRQSHSVQLVPATHCSKHWVHMSAMLLIQRQVTESWTHSRSQTLKVWDGVVVLYIEGRFEVDVWALCTSEWEPDMFLSSLWKMNSVSKSGAEKHAGSSESATVSVVFQIFMVAVKQSNVPKNMCNILVAVSGWRWITRHIAYGWVGLVSTVWLCCVCNYHHMALLGFDQDGFGGAMITEQSLMRRFRQTADTLFITHSAHTLDKDVCFKMSGLLSNAAVTSELLCWCWWRAR